MRNRDRLLLLLDSARLINHAQLKFGLVRTGKRKRWKPFFPCLYKCRSIWISLLPLSIYEIFDNLSRKIRVLYILKLAYYREMGGVS